MPFQYSDSEYIKLNRKILNWEWYDDVNTRLLFIHCLLRANWMETSWHGVKLKRGEFITSLASLAEETNLSVRNVRTALKHLKATGEVTSRKYAKFRIISIKNWDLYQQSD
ncbi:MAG: hypothetical protein Q4B15_07930, partial [Lachnospiraceae bacterium]|nr:hypothetical protein [Lachnospiraceae bacterium]